MAGNIFTDGYGQFLLPHRILADYQFLASATTKVVTGNIYGFDGALLYEATLTTTTTALKAKDSAWTATVGGAVLPWSDTWAGLEVLTTTATAYAKPGLGVTATAANSTAINVGYPIGALPQAIYDTYWLPGGGGSVSGSNGAVTETTPTVATATSTTLLAANTARKYLLIQNNTAANIMISLSGKTLTGIVPTNTNIGFVIAVGASYSSDRFAPTGAITVYQTSGGTVNTISVAEG